MKRLIIFLGLLLFVLTSFVSAQEKLRVAVFDPAISGKNFDEGTGVIIREMVSSAIVNTGKYTIIERSLIDKILNEQKFSNSGAVDDNQISQLGKLAGANKVVLSVLSSAGNKCLLSLKVIDVESASIESQKAQLVEHSKIYDLITPLALEVIGETTAPTASASKQEKEKPGIIGRLFGGKNTAEPKNEPQSNKGKFAERMNREEDTDFPVSSPVVNTTNTTGNNEIMLFFAGYSSGKNPNAQIYMDDVLIGNGTLNQGFSISIADNNPGKHQIKIEWSGTISSKTYNINTGAQQRFVFEYARTGFGYAFQLKD